MGFGETVSPIEVIRSILGSYTFGYGIFREFLQNSDDAAATEQVFILDRRSHPAAELLDDQLRDVQGPAVLAFNNAQFTDEDWKAIQTIHRSSKTVDTSKIGKYGLGFRSCYHMTDCPQILSGSGIAILDPLSVFTNSGGIKEDFTRTNINMSGHIDAFSSTVTPPISLTSEYGGTIFRFPLRACTSGLSKDLISPNEIRDLLNSFIIAELDICLLFLNHVNSIKIYEIQENGEVTLLASRIKAPVEMAVERTTLDSTLVTYKMDEVSITDQFNTMRKWHILETFYEQPLAVTKLSSKPGCQNCEDIIRDHKLMPNVSLACPLDMDTKYTDGKLFTFLPLPIPTEFPVHIHSLFALTSSRENLRNPTDSGIVRGSTDHILVEWNKVLFEVFIPEAWSLLVNNLVKKERISNIFHVFPSKQLHISAGDTLYWQELPTKLIQIASSLKIWPTSETVPHYCCLAGSDSDLLVAAPNEKSDILNLLASISVGVMSPPKDVLEILEDSGINYKRLIPSILPSHLRGEMLVSLNDFQAATLLKYLLSHQGLINILNLPLIPSCDGSRLSLQKKDGAMAHHTLLSLEEFSLFGDLDPNGVNLQAMDRSISDLLRREGPSILNISPLGPNRVLNYLTARLRGSPNPIPWLSKFWIWLSTREFGREVLHNLHQDPSVKPIPSSNGLCNLHQPIFSPCGELQVILSQFGVRFPHSELSSAVVPALARLEILRSIEDLGDLVDAMSVPTETLAAPDAQKVLHHLQQGQKSAKLNNQLLRKLHSFPIFPILLPHEGKASSPDSYILWGNIPSHQQIKATSYDGPLPTSQVVVYLQLSKLRPLTVSNDLGLSIKSPHSKTEVTLFAIQSLPNQNPSWQLSLLQYLKDSRDVLGRGIYTTLEQIRFVPARDGTIQAPQSLVDPTCDVANILLPNENTHYLAAIQGEEGPSIISTLTEMQLLSRNMEQKFIQESIMYASMVERNANSRDSMSRAIIKTLIASRWDCSGLKECFDAEWLPTSKGLKRPTQCRHPRDSKLFDQVIPVLGNGLKISDSLRSALGWDQPVAFAIMLEQLKKVLQFSDSSTRRDYLITLIDELNGRFNSLGPSQISLLQSAIHDKQWIPVGKDTLVSTDDVVFTYVDSSTGFHRVPDHRHYWNQFLGRMGCAEYPMKPRIIWRLNILRDQNNQSEEVLNQTVKLLELLQRISPDEREQIPIPLQDGTFGVLANVYFDDIKSLSPEKPVAHQVISMQLADRLGMERIGLICNPDAPWLSTLEMGEKPVTTIRNVLKQYVKEQIFTEFIANAADANASSLSLLLDETTVAPTENLISSQFSLFRGPSLVIHNDAKFSMQDFQGICKTGRGGKVGRSDTIGQFGLGSLAMFHFTEVAIIVSGEYVLFLNPSGLFLPGGRNVLMMQLSTLKRNYDGHLSRLHGLFNFDANPLDTTYNGTLFALSLRTHDQVRYTNIQLPTQYTEEDTKLVSEIIPSPTSVKELLWGFQRDNYRSCLFSGIRFISASRRTTSIETLWDIHAHYQQGSVSEHDNFTAGLMTFSGKNFEGQKKWLVVKGSIPNTADCIADVTHLPERYHQSTFKVEMAAGLESTARIPHNIFSTLPLPITTTLPSHVSAPFVLAPDRRNIRLDGYQNTESLFNKWILSKGIPRLYYYLLQEVGKIESNGKVWPSASPQTISDSVTSGFYDNDMILNTPYHIVQDMHISSKYLRPSDAVFLPSHTPKEVKDFLVRLRIEGLVSVSDGAMELVQKTSLRVVDPRFVRSLLENPGNCSIFSELTMGHLSAIIEYLIKDSHPENLYGLPLLPLENGLYGTFGDPESTETLTYYVWQPLNVANMRLFRPVRFVSPAFSGTKFLSRGLNISLLDGKGVVQMLREHFKSCPEVVNPTGHRHWLSEFWSEPSLYNLCVEEPSFSSFPLVPCSRMNTHVSLQECQLQSTAIIRPPEGLDKPPPFHSLESLGMPVIFADPDPSHLPNTLYRILSKDKYPSVTLEQILAYASNSTNMNWRAAFEHLALAEWTRNNITHVSLPMKNIMLTLPIWHAAKQGVHGRLRPANEVSILPSGISLDNVAPFVPNFVATYSVVLEWLKGSALKYSQCIQMLRPPALLPQKLDQQYRGLLTSCLEGISRERDGSSTTSILVPDTRRQMVPCETLYRRDQVFMTIFGDDNSRFLYPQFGELEDTLTAFGLKQDSQTDGIDIQAFIECASVLERTQDIRKRAGALRLAEIYTEIFPHVLSFLEMQSWYHQLNGKRFLPKNDNHWPSHPGFNTDKFVKRLRRVFIAPSEIVLPRYEGICWSQKALPASEDGVNFNQVPSAYPSFGKPSVHDVIQHLRVLSCEIAQEYPGDPAVLNCLTETYNWLNDNSLDAQNVLKSNEPVFLNINDPSTETWIGGWTAGCHILLDDIHDIRDLKIPRNYLRNFTRLLEVAGAIKLKDIDFSALQVDSEESKEKEDEWSSVFPNFSFMRREKELVDVCFIPEDEQGTLTPIYAHRALLAAVSDHFRRSFLGGTIESSRAASVENPVQIKVPATQECLEAVISYLYTKQMPEFTIQSFNNGKQINLLLDMLDLTNSWELDNLKKFVEKQIIRPPQGFRFIAPDNVREIQGRAEISNALLLIKACKQFQLNNEKYMTELIASESTN